MAMISIIVPVYNAQEYLESCVESILRQDYADFELLLIDDGSSDGSGDICDKFAAKDRRVRCYHRQNSGVGHTRNFGIEQAMGEWICFVDADDEVRPNYLSSFYTEHTDADVVISGIDFVNIATNTVMRKEVYVPKSIDLEKDSKSLIPLLSIGFPCAKVYKSKFLLDHKLRFPTDISFHEDHVFVLDCYLQCSLLEVKDNVTYIYRIDYTHQSLSKKKHPWQNHYKASCYMFDRLFKIKDAYGFNDHELRSMYTFAYDSMISAVYDLYDSHCYKKERKRILRQLLKETLPINIYYFPSTKRGKLIKTMSTVLPLSLLDIFFKIVNRYQNRRK